MPTLYWAAPCFTLAERLLNRTCAGHLNTLGYDVILPQNIARDFTVKGVLDAAGLARELMTLAVRADLFVAVLDGADADSGASYESGARVVYCLTVDKPAYAIGVRTDFRGSGDDGGTNAMFRNLDEIIYLSSLECDDPEILCNKIDHVLRAHLAAHES